ncbi:centrosomal protein of 131 kDa isoform X2 [Neocloeon triangulifer]|uniref:centrosomal protein of 131 kDa isoform X2 n=1 Tax=Neocloeon triangulifer TaxID=2078957 RepID=UPI00286EE73C|nr:centrosomal protein of 131 kDa isoform X2 [Neocloeon triangulifer]
MPSIIKSKASAACPAAGRKSGICLSGSHLNLTQRPGNTMLRSTSPVKSSTTVVPLQINKRPRPKSAVPTMRQKSPNNMQKSRPLSANVPVIFSKIDELSEAVDSNSSSPTYLASDEISLWMSEEMSRAENKSAESMASTSKIISPFSDSTSSPAETEKSTPKHLRFADEGYEDDFINSVVEQLKEQVKYEMDDVSGAVRRVKVTSSRKKRPKSLIELMEIIDGEIPIELKKSSLPLKTHKKTSISVSDSSSGMNSKLAENTMKMSEATREKTLETTKTTVKEKEAFLDNFNSITVIKESAEDIEPQTTKETQQKSARDCLKSIFNFLDEAERSETQLVHKITPFPAPESELASNNMKGSKQIEILKEALEEKAAHVQLLKESLLQARVESADALAAADKEHRVMARKQKLDYEAALKKLQDGMEKLLSDKKSLVEKVEELVQKLREAENKHLGAIQALQQRQTVEIARTKQIAAAAEKVRREKWVERQTARIKELTVKGLEPELTRLNLQHENKVAQIQANHSRELQSQIEAEARRVEELRSLMLKEKDEELARERTLVSERYERQLAEERAMMEIRSERIKEEANSEAARMQAHWNSQKETLIAQAWQEAQRVQALHDQQILLLEEKKQAEIAAAKEELREEQATWLTAQNRKNAELLAAKQQELKDQRDQEIEKAIERLEAEERRSKSEHQKETEKKIQRLKDQHKSILADRDLNEKLLQSRLSEAQKGLEDSEKQLLVAKSNESRLRQELCISEQRVQALEISDLEQKVEQTKADREAELEQVHARLKGVLEKKDQHIEQLKVQEGELTKRCKHLESLLGR